MISFKDVVIYFVLMLTFGIVTFLVLAILFHPHATPFSVKTINIIFKPSLIAAFAIVFILPAILIRTKKNKKRTE